MKRRPLKTQRDSPLHPTTNTASTHLWNNSPWPAHKSQGQQQDFLPLINGFSSPSCRRHRASVVLHSSLLHHKELYRIWKPGSFKCTWHKHCYKPVFQSFLFKIRSRYTWLFVTGSICISLKSRHRHQAESFIRNLLYAKFLLDLDHFYYWEKFGFGENLTQLCMLKGAKSIYLWLWDTLLPSNYCNG